MRTAALARLGLLFGRMERARMLELARIAAELTGAEDKLATHTAACTLQQSERRTAYAQADAAEQHVQHAVETRALRDAPHLRGRIATAAAQRDRDAQIYRESRHKRERMDALLERAAALAHLSETRATQAAMDDRFAARQAWLRLADEFNADE